MDQGSKKSITLSLMLRRRLAKAALRDALARLKRARPLALLSAFERRWARWRNPDT